jgi:hypothetical protein
MPLLMHTDGSRRLSPKHAFQLRRSRHRDPLCIQQLQHCSSTTEAYSSEEVSIKLSHTAGLLLRRTSSFANLESTRPVVWRSQTRPESLSARNRS